MLSRGVSAALVDVHGRGGAVLQPPDAPEAVHMRQPLGRALAKARTSSGEDGARVARRCPGRLARLRGIRPAGAPQHSKQTQCMAEQQRCRTVPLASHGTWHIAQHVASHMQLGGGVRVSITHEAPEGEGFDGGRRYTTNPRSPPRAAGKGWKDATTRTEGQASIHLASRHMSSSSNMTLHEKTAVASASSPCSASGPAAGSVAAGGEASAEGPSE